MRLLILQALVVIMALSGCSVVMASRGSHPPDLSQIRPGTTKAEVTALLGSPDSTIRHERGSTSVYQFEVGDESSPGRAVAHGVMDVLTWGIWEAIGTPIELFAIGESRVLIVDFDQDDRVVSAIKSPPKE